MGFFKAKREGDGGDLAATLRRAVPGTSEMTFSDPREAFDLIAFLAKLKIAVEISMRGSRFRCELLRLTPNKPQHDAFEAESIPFAVAAAAALFAVKYGVQGRLTPLT